MGLLSHFFTSTDGLAATYDGGAGWPQDNVVHAKGMTSLEASTLWSILDGQEWDADRMNAFQSLLEDDEDGPWIDRLPADLVRKLAHATPAELEAAGVEWAATEEIEADPKDIGPILTDLQRLAKAADESGRSVFLWVSL